LGLFITQFLRLGEISGSFGFLIGETLGKS